jgi:hypothetical protein
MNLIENKAISEIPAAYQELIRAKINHPAISSMGDYELEVSLKNIVMVSYAEMGLKDSVDTQTATFLRQTLMKDFKRIPFCNATVQEIELFISRGLRGEYGTFKGQLNVINVQNIHHWVRSGLTSKDRELAMKEFNKKLQEQETVQLTEEQKFEILKAGARKRFLDYKEGGNLGIGAYVIYDTINKIKGVETSTGKKSLITDPQTREKVWKECKVELERKYSQEKRKAERGGNHTLAGSISEFMVSDSTQGELHMRCKEKFLRIYFDSLISNGKTLEI